MSHHNNIRKFFFKEKLLPHYENKKYYAKLYCLNNSFNSLTLVNSIQLNNMPLFNYIQIFFY